MVSLFACVALCVAAGAGEPGLAAVEAEGAMTVTGPDFAVTVAAAHGGQITSLRAYDGVEWHEVLEGTFPDLRFTDGRSEWALAHDARKGRIVRVAQDENAVRIHTYGVLRRLDGAGSPWGVDLRYEIYPEGAVFVELECRLVDVSSTLAEATASFKVADAVAALPKYRAEQLGKQDACMPSFRAAFGADPARSFTNEIEVIVEDRRPLFGTSAGELGEQGATWRLGTGRDTLEPGFTYRNRFAIGLGATPGAPRSNAVGQRVYHWVNWLDLVNWYPNEEQIDAMVANHATMLILHHEYMLQRGSNGYPHAEYRVARDQDAMVRMMDCAHKRGLRVGLYMRGVEWYALETGFFEKYCQRDWDGIYLDWHGPFGVSWHENLYEPEPFLGDRHFSRDGSYAPAHAYFLMTRRLREMVGANGFLIGHQGSFNSGVFANLCFDAFLPGETGSDRLMFAHVDEAVYKGMQAGSVCMPWTLDLPKYRNAEGAAKMAVWGFYPHVVMGIKARQAEAVVFSNDPNDAEYAFVLPYWRLLAQIDVEHCEVFNLPSQRIAAAASSIPAVGAAVYREASGRYLVVAGNLGAEPAGATLTLSTEVLGMTGGYEAERIDAATGAREAHAFADGALVTSDLPQWGIEGYLLTPK
ncbi:MAG: hypothetical protein JXR94_02285 [Candidatus Hydrogenedentes bacterium]|nr:hypothetical protein [Candidatus Hydrogenedentota bacterium]